MSSRDRKAWLARKCWGKTRGESGGSGRTPGLEPRHRDATWSLLGSSAKGELASPKLPGGNKHGFSRAIQASVFLKWSSGDGNQTTNMPTFLPPFSGKYQRPRPGDIKRKRGIEG